MGKKNSKMTKCPEEDCGKIGEGRFCSACGATLIPNLCSARLEDGSQCQNQRQAKRKFCKGCLEKIDETLLEVRGNQSSEHHPQTAMEIDQGINLMERCRLPQVPGRSDDEISELRRIAQGGAEMMKNYLETKNNEWRKIDLHIGVTGASGSGKSSFINAIRGIKSKYEEGYAETGVVETTTSVKPYCHPKNPSLIFWDMPGVGTRSFPKDRYLQAVSFKKYEFFLILFHKRLGEGDAWLAKQAKQYGKACFFVRTHVDDDVRNNKRDDPRNHSKERVLRIIRENCAKELECQGLGSKEVFLIDNHETKVYDFDKLTTRLINSGFLDDQKRKAFVLSLTILTDGVIVEKKKAMEDRIWIVAFASAVGGAVPIPGFGALVDIGIIINEYTEYRRQFGLTDEHLKSVSHLQMARDFLQKYARNVAQIALFIGVDETVEAVFKFGLPIIGQLISGSMSYAFTVRTLQKLLNEVVEDAKTLNDKLMHELSTSSGV